MTKLSFDFLTKLILLFTAYFVTARLGLSLDAVSGFASLVWPPTGIALAALLIFGYRYWPAIAVGAFFVNLLNGATPPVAFGISIGNTLEALAGAYLLNRPPKLNHSLNTVKDILKLVFFAAILSTSLSATIGVTSLYLGDSITSTYGETWIAWWVGDMLGALVVAPLLLAWSSGVKLSKDAQQIAKTIMPFILLISVSIFAFRWLPESGVTFFPLIYLIFPFLIWIALKFGQRGSALAVFIVSTTAIWGMISTQSTVASRDLNQSLLLLQSFIGISSITFMIMAAVVSEKEQTQKKEQILALKAFALSKERARLKAINKAKDEFISIASHQLRTPATGVKQYLGMLLASYVGKPTKKQHTFIATAYESNERQIKVINDLLRVAKLDSGKIRMEKQDCDINKLASTVVKQLASQFEERKQKIIFKPTKNQVKTLADKELLHMALENILDNAGKYSPEGSEINVSVSQDNKYIYLSVSDTGIGIMRKDHKKLFQKFLRISNPKSNYVDGSGLGLYWAKKIVDLHRGKISVSSGINKGSTFVISLPALNNGKPNKQKRR